MSANFDRKHGLVAAEFIDFSGDVVGFAVLIARGFFVVLGLDFAIVAFAVWTGLCFGVLSLLLEGLDPGCTSLCLSPRGVS